MIHLKRWRIQSLHWIHHSQGRVALVAFDRLFLVSEHLRPLPSGLWHCSHMLLVGSTRHPRRKKNAKKRKKRSRWFFQCWAFCAESSAQYQGYIPVSSSKILAFCFFFTRGRGAESLLKRGWHYSGNQSCATDAGCTCEANELECEDVANVVVGWWFSRGANKKRDCVKLKWAVVSFAVYSKVYWICFGMKNYPYE